MKKTKFYSLLAIFLMFVVALTCGFLFACNKEDESDDDPDVGILVPDEDDQDDDDDEETVTVESVTVTPDTATIGVGETVELSASAKYSDGTDYSGAFTWASSDETIATATRKILNTSSGTVTGIGAGTATVSVTAGGKSAECVVTVTALPVGAYKGTLSDWGEEYSDYHADFTNAEGLKVTKGTDANGGATYTFEGVVARFTEAQVLAFNVGEDNGEKNGVTTNDGYIIVEIFAEPGYTVSYAGVEETVKDGETSVIFLQAIRNKTDKAVTIKDTDGNTVSSFTVVFANVIIPDSALVGTWSSEKISATAMYLFQASASAELIVDENGTYTLKISNIAVEGLDVDLSAYEVEMEGTWIGGEGSYTLTGKEGNTVTVAMKLDEETEEAYIEISFSITYDFEGLSIPISVTGATLTKGALETGDTSDE